MNTIAYFEYNRKKYIITLLQNKVLKFFVKENDRIKVELSKEEIAICEKVINCIKVEKRRSINLGMKSYNNQLFRLFYDTQLKLYYTDSNNQDIVSYLNFKYNNTPTICASSSKNATLPSKNTKKFFEVPIKIGKKIVMISIVVGVSLFAVSSCDSPEKYSNISVYEENQENSQYNYSNIENAINRNKYFSDKEKDFLKRLRFLFDENHQYMDMKTIIKRLETMRIYYYSEDDEKNIKGLNGVYSYQKNQIRMYNISSFEECDISVFVHEFLHSLQKASNSFLMELSNELFTRETIRRLYDSGQIQKDGLNSDNKLEEPVFGKAYDNYMPIYYTLAEIVDERYLRAFQFEGDTNILIYGLSHCENSNEQDSQKAFEFVASINEARNYDKEVGTYLPEENAFPISKKSYDCLDYYYKIKNGHGIDEDLDVALYYLQRINLVGFFYDRFMPYSEDVIKKVIEPILLEHSEVTDEEGLLGFWRNITAKSYLTNDHEISSITFTYNSPATTTVELNNSINEEFREEYTKYKEAQNEIECR